MSLAIAIDAMGGDNAPRAVVRGAVDAARAHPDLKLLLVGREATLHQELEELDWRHCGIEVVPAEHVIEMGETPLEALRRKKDSSIEVAVRLVRSREAAAMVSAGNTGACVAAGTLRLGLLPEVRRAGIAVTLRAGDSPVVVIDVGANIASRPEHLIQYGIMANLYARSVLRIQNPRVGLLNVGEETEKGNPLAKTTHALFRKTRLNFVGNVEGVEIFRGMCDVVVCDGFVGNIVLKVSEGLAERLVGLFKDILLVSSPAAAERTAGEKLLKVGAGSLVDGGEVGRAGGSQEGALKSLGGADLGKRVDGGLLSAFTRLCEKLDYAEYGGAPLLGVNGVMVIAHGRSDARAITNAIGVARRMAETDVNKHISEEILACAEPD